MSASPLDIQLKELESQLNAFNKLFANTSNAELLIHQELLEALQAGFISMAGNSSGLKEGAEKEGRIVSYHSQNLDVLKKLHTAVSSDTSPGELFRDLLNALEQYLESIPEQLSMDYPPEAFTVRREDPFRIRFALYVSGLFSRHSRKKEKESGKRTVSVHFKKLVKGFLLPLYLNALSDRVKENQNKLIDSYTALLDQEHKFMQDNYSIRKEELSKFRLDATIFQTSGPEGFFNKYRPELEVYLLRSGLFLSTSLWRNMSGSLDYNKSRDGLGKANRSWQTTFFALFEDWRLHEQLFAYLHKVQLGHREMEEIYCRRIESSLSPEVEKQMEYTSGLMKKLPDPDQSDMEAIRTFFVAELYRLKKEKIQEDQKAQLLQTVEDIPKLLHKLGNELEDDLDIFPEKAGVVSNPKYRNGIKASEIFYFSPAEFIEFKYLSSIHSRLDQHRAELGKDLKTILNEFNEYDQIIDFYLDSTISLTEKPGMNESEVITFFREGLQRLLNISKRISDMLQGLEKEKLAEIEAHMREYLHQIAELDNNDNIISLYTHLLKSKALAESRTSREKFFGFIKRTWSRVARFISRQSRWFQTSYSDIRKRLRLDSSSQPISSDISNYLTDVQNRIYKLPLIYQHLFENIPIREFNLFLSREEEIGKLNIAYTDWIKDNFAASLVVGENGSGKSSLLHYYSKTLKTNYKIQNFQVSGFYYTEEDYYRLIREIFAQEELADDATIAAHISSFTECRIIIIDGLERLFIRKVNGFTCLQKLLSLIVSSNNQIFWICSVSKYASLYLNKTSGLSEYFDYIIDTDTLSSEQVRDIVLKRNRLSGYELSYQIGIAEDEGSRSKNLTHSELEDRFFSELNRFAGSNISLSLTYWLQSIQSFGEDRIEIGHFPVPDFGFLESISPEKAYTLLVVLMHGKLTMEQHAMIFNQPLERSYKVLSILKEDSVLVKKGEYFILNGILFRHVVRMLENRNLIH